MMKVNNEKAIQVNNELKINVEQHVDMKHLKEKCDIDDRTIVKKIRLCV